MTYKGFVMRTFILIFSIIFFSCNREKEEVRNSGFKHTKKSLEDVNRVLVDKDIEIIKTYIGRRGWDMELTESGLWFMEYEEGSGALVKKGDYITMSYELWLMDGTLCYSSDELGLKSFIVGKGGVESGLEEGVLLLKKGSKARLILPPHLAHGLLGDENRIPARATIIYDLEILKVEE